MIDTFSIFYYLDEVTKENQNLPFDEGSGEVNSVVDPGSYALSELTVAVETALNAASVARVFTVSVDRDTGLVTIAADGTFDLLISTGSTTGSSIFSLLGFTGSVDLTGASTYTGDSRSPDVYEPQFKFQSYVSPDDFQEAADASVNETASGNVEVVSYGLKTFYEFDIKYITNNAMDGKVIKNNPSGVNSARLFFRNITRRTRFELMPDISDRDTFDKVILDSIPGNRTATGYKLNELFRQNLRDIYEVNGIRLRVVT